MNHELLISKLDACGFDHKSLSLTYSYLSDRHHRTKVNNSFSTLEDISSGVPQGSIIGPLLLNIYITDIFFFINEESIANYADDNTVHHATNNQIDALINTLEEDTSILIN